MKTKTSFQTTPSFLLDPPDIPDEELEAVLREAFADVAKKHQKNLTTLQEEIKTLIQEAAQANAKI